MGFPPTVITASTRSFENLDASKLYILQELKQTIYIKCKAKHYNSAVWVFKALALKQNKYNTSFQGRAAQYSDDYI